MREAAELIGYAAVLTVVEQQVAGRAGISCGSLRVLTRVSALVESGTAVRVADVLAAKAAASGETRQNIKRLLASGHLQRRGGLVNGRLLVPEAGRKVLAELVRGMQRARQQLACFEPCPPFRRVVPKKPAKATGTNLEVVSQLDKNPSEGKIEGQQSGEPDERAVNESGVLVD